jgi:hypothetical protein
MLGRDLPTTGLHTHFLYDKGRFFYYNQHHATTVYTIDLKNKQKTTMLYVTLFVANYRDVSHPVGEKQWSIKTLNIAVAPCMVPQRH